MDRCNQSTDICPGRILPDVENTLHKVVDSFGNERARMPPSFHWDLTSKPLQFISQSQRMRPKVTIDKKQLQQELADRQNAYTQLQKGAGALLAINKLYWTERLLLWLAQRIAVIRLRQLAEILPDDH